jgi:transposase
MDTLVMSARERRRLIVFSQVKQKAISVAEAARSLLLSERQGRRVWKRYREKGDAGLIHGLRGRKGNAGREALRAKVLALYRQKYATCNASHATMLMLEKEKLSVSRKTLWRWLKGEDLIVQPRRRKKHRQRRERRRCTGELLQMDGSTHRWLGEAPPYCVLFVMIDDATGQVFARFYESEDAASAFDLFGRYVRGHGLPLALYVDHDSIYVVNESDAQAERRQAAGKRAKTQFGRAMEELSVQIIAANSPQAKGRVERVNRTLQDRLVKELAMAGVKDMEAANAFLEQTFLKAFNREFGKVPASGANVHHKVPSHVKLEEVLCPKLSAAIPELRGTGLPAGKNALAQTQATGPCAPEAPGEPSLETKLPRHGPPPRDDQHGMPPGRKNSRRGQGCSIPLGLAALASFHSTALTTPHPPVTLLLRH